MEKLFIVIQYLVPHHLLSRLVGILAETKLSGLKNLLIKQFIRIYKVNMAEAVDPIPENYENFNAFFTRELKAGTRPVDMDDHSVCCPADGVISQSGIIDRQRILQAKGIDYSVSRLLGNSSSAQKFQDGSFATIYLSPRDYHRVHMPTAGKLRTTRYIPGELFSVNDKTAQGLDGLFARNERLVCEFNSELVGDFAVIFVGAMLVAGIETVWGGYEKPGPGAVRESDYSDQELAYAKGEEIGQFRFGSTVIVLFGENKVSGLENLSLKTPVIMGEKLAILT